MYRKPNIAIIEDNEDLMDDVLFFLQGSGYNTWGSKSAEYFWRQLHAEPTDIVLVDVGLPGEDGFSVARHLSSLNKFGMIIITARGDQQDKLEGLSSGADLYLIKPINFLSLVEAIDTLWKRICDNTPESAKCEESKVIVSSTHALPEKKNYWQLDDGSHSATFRGVPISLSTQEYALLKQLVDSPGQILNKQDLHDSLFGHVEDVDLHRVDVLLSRLRVKLKLKNIKFPIHSIFGKGVVFKSND
ncbi:response regulator transcription factor [Marinomonas sp.]|uniref:response regulator transcription factor n=1 Tax=Marinomonas sp. TaxID=1904862 RepID=UPI003BAA7776